MEQSVGVLSLVNGGLFRLNETKPCHGSSAAGLAVCSNVGNPETKTRGLCNAQECAQSEQPHLCVVVAEQVEGRDFTLQGGPGQRWLLGTVAGRPALQLSNHPTSSSMLRLATK